MNGVEPKVMTTMTACMGMFGFLMGSVTTKMSHYRLIDVHNDSSDVCQTSS